MSAQGFVASIAVATVLANVGLGWDWRVAVVAGGVVFAFGQVAGVVAMRHAPGPPEPPPGSAPSRPGSPLTKTELEVARLVAEGLTNREIAERTFRSERTIDSHLEHIYTKLDINSRVELVNWLRPR